MDVLENIQKKLFDLIGIEVDDDQNKSEEKKAETPNGNVKNSKPRNIESKIVSIRDRMLEVTVYNLKFFDEVAKISDALKENKVVLFNLEQVADEQCQRIIDFVSGSVYVLNAKIHKISKKIFVVVPMDVELEVDEQLKEDIKSKGLIAWLK